jgi:hypothetical protein
MDDPKPGDGGELYETDFFAWTESQAKALRAHGRGDNAIDYDRLAEEIEDVGRSELAACESFVLLVLRHLLKLAHGTRTEPRAGWRREVVAYRIALGRRLTPSIRAKLERGYALLWRDAAALARADFAVDEPDTPLDLPDAPAFTLEEAIDPDFWPDVGARR